jgi:hypothetical protein
VSHGLQTLTNSARNRLDLAREACAHWDYESDGEGHPCCKAVQVALEAYRDARKVIRRATRP